MIMLWQLKMISTTKKLKDYVLNMIHLSIPVYLGQLSLLSGPFREIDILYEPVNAFRIWILKKPNLHQTKLFNKLKPKLWFCQFLVFSDLLGIKENGTLTGEINGVLKKFIWAHLKPNYTLTMSKHRNLI